MTHTLTFAQLQKGQAFARLPLALTAEEVQAYLASTGESSPLWDEFIPPIFLDAIAIATLLETVAIPRGVMHTGQEHETHRAARVGEPLELEMRVTALSERKGAIIANFEATITGSPQTDADDPVATMKISVMALPDGVTA